MDVYMGVVAKYRHHISLHGIDFCDADDDEPIPIPRSDLNELGGIFPAVDNQIQTPFDSLWEDVPLAFVLKVDDKLYLVNTEGFEYCKFVTRCIVV